MDTQRLYQLLERYAAHAASPAEERELFGLIAAGPEPELKGALHGLLEATGPQTGLDRARWQPVLERILSTARSLEGGERLPIRRLFPWTRIAAAAAIIGILVTGAWLWTHRAPHSYNTNNSAGAIFKDIAPGGQHAVLTLAGGSTIILDSAHNGQLASQGNTDIVKLDNGRLAYRPANAVPTEIVYNTIRTPRGGFYQLGLPDGTQVWLNAASSLRFPTAFTSGLREVEMTGEAYFEVAADKSHPFIVHTRGTSTTVLGTAFNITAYEDEQTLQTTLLQGSVQFSGDENNNGNTALLRPGQQSVFDPIGRGIKVRPADTAAAVAWKNGQFPLKGTDMAALMRQVARWYDVDVQFEGPVPDRKFGGSISRNVNLSAVLEALKENGVDCRLEGKTLKVTK